MITTLLLAGALLVSGPPDINTMDVLGQRSTQCPNGTPIEATYYVDSQSREPVMIVWSRNGVPVVAQDLKTMEVYIYREKKSYPLDESMKKYPTPCDLPYSDA